MWQSRSKGGIEFQNSLNPPGSTYTARHSTKAMRVTFYIVVAGLIACTGLSLLFVAIAGPGGTNAGGYVAIITVIILVLFSCEDYND